MTVPFSSYGAEIYLRGLADQRPEWPTDPSRLEEAAHAALADEPFGYVAGGAGTGATMRANRAAFDRHRLVPRMLRDATERVRVSAWWVGRSKARGAFGPGGARSHTLALCGFADLTQLRAAKDAVSTVS